MRLVIEACDSNNIGEVERLRVVEKLQAAKSDKFFVKPLPYDGQQRWLDNALQPETLNQLDAVLVEDETPCDKTFTVENVPEDVFDNRRECQVPRDAQSLARAARCLLIGTESIVLVDPYLTPSRACSKVLKALVTQSYSEGTGLKAITIHCAHSKVPNPPADIITNYQRWLSAELGNGLNLKVCRWNDDVLDFDFHARYLIAGSVGLRYDRGFVEPPDHGERAKNTDVVCMEPKTVSDIEQRYSIEGPADQLVDEILIN